jgi:4-alpha-glucanotransferase
LFAYLGREISAEEVCSALIRLAMMSAAKTVIFPLQDILGLGAEARMNRPSTAHGNSEWRFTADQISSSARDKLLALTRTYGRKPDAVSIKK